MLGQVRGWVTGLTLVVCGASGCAGKVVPGDQNDSSGGRAAVTGKAGASPVSTPPASTGSGQSPAMNAGGSGFSSASTGSAGAGGAAVRVDPPVPSSSSGGAAGIASGGSGAGAPVLVPGSDVPLIPTDGWIDGATNAAHIQGAVFGAADATSAMSLISDVSGSNACIRGTAARVDMAAPTCVNRTFTPPATDCYGEFWGAELGLNLNQPIDPTPQTAGTPLPYNASALRGFSFELSGDTVPGPKDIRFQVENDNQTFCNPASKKLKVGSNTVLFSELVTECFRAQDPPAATAETAQSALIRLSWLVVTNTASSTPYDFCVSNLRALVK